jgi:hypothetical protein
VSTDWPQQFGTSAGADDGNNDYFCLSDIDCLRSFINNLCKIHGAVRCTPAMAAGVEQSQWTVEELVDRCGE